MRRGFSLHELLISLTMVGIVFGLTTHFAVQQMRAFRHLADVGRQRSEIEHVAEIVRNVLANVSPATGELLAAQDSALEIRATTGTSLVCGSVAGEIMVPAPGSTGSIGSAFLRAPAPGDRLSALLSDSTGVTWLHLQIASAPEPGGPCSFNPAFAATWRLTTFEPLSLPPGTPLRFTRPLRLSLYRSSDDRWYLGARDWNGESRRFNSIQPVAGPMRRHTDGPESGLRFEYRDVLGRTLSQPVDAARVASVIVTARAPADSLAALVRLPNAR